MSAFEVDKKTKRIVKFTKDNVAKSFASLGVNVLAVIAGTSYAYSVEDAAAQTLKTFETKVHILCTKYLGQQKTTIVVFEVPSYILNVNIAIYMLRLRDIIGASHDSMWEEWTFGIMINVKTFYSIPNWLDMEGHRLAVIVTRRKPDCGHFWKTSHQSTIFPEKKIPLKTPHHIWNSLSLTIAKRGSHRLAYRQDISAHSSWGKSSFPLHLKRFQKKMRSQRGSGWQ